MLGFLLQRLRRLFWSSFYRVLGRLAFAEVGKGVTFEGWVETPQRGGRIVIGDRAHICRLVEFSVPAGGQLVIAEGVFVGRGVVVSAHNRVRIGRNTLVAEFVSIHDNDHRFGDPALTIADQGFDSEPLEIGADCWVGAQAVLVRGSGLGDRCILGAGAVLTKRFPSGTTVVGVPGRTLAPRSPAPSPG